MQKEIIYEEGSKKIKSQDLKQYTRLNSDWINLDEMPISTKTIIQNYKNNLNIDPLIDTSYNEFLKGHITSDGKLQGKRISHLPNGKKLARGAFHIYAKNLELNTKDKNKSWAVKYENTSGLKTYLYDEDNIEHEHKRKASIVNKFIRLFPIISEKLERDLKQKKDIKFLALKILIETRMRVGNLEYFILDKHKGLTTLQKKDIQINDNKIRFTFIGKDAILQDIEKEFSNEVINQLKNILKDKNPNDFVFTTKNQRPIHSETFSDILFDYTNEHFYPHIIRSFYADLEARKFIRNHNKATKKEVLDKFKEIAKELGHKKWNKNKQAWETDYKITCDNYIRPQYVERMKSLIEK